MIRWSLVSLFFGALIAGAVIYFVGWPKDPPTAQQLRAQAPIPAPQDDPSKAAENKQDLGEPLFRVAFNPPPPRELIEPIVASSSSGMSDIVVPDCHLIPNKGAEVPCERDGTLLFVATEISPFDENHPEYRDLFKLVGDTHYELDMTKIDPSHHDKYFHRYITVVAVQAKDTEKVKPSERLFPYASGKEASAPAAGDKLPIYRRHREGDKLELTTGASPALSPNFKIYKEQRWFRELSLTNKVKEGDLLALVKPALVVDEVKNKEAAYYAKYFDWQATLSIKDEAQNHWRYLRDLQAKNIGAVAKEDVESAWMNYERYRSEAVSKAGLFQVGEQELSQAITSMKMHFIYAPVDGTIIQVYKHKGEAVKTMSQDQVVQLQNLDRLLVEGQIGVQYLPYLKKDMLVHVEPTIQEPFLQSLPGHPFEINAVAVSNDLDNPQIVSVSEDGSIRIWGKEAKTGQRFVEVGKLIESDSDTHSGMQHAVKCVACSPVGSGEDLCVTGDSDGTVKLWDLKSKTLVKSWKAHHNTIVNCAAFHPSGKFFATGAENGRILLFRKTDDGWDQSYIFPEGHKGGVTSVQFAGPSRLVSAGNDKQILTWDLRATRARLDDYRFDRRSGEVTTLGVSPDGSSVLFDRGRELHVLSLDQHRTEVVIQNPSGAASFNDFALFSPDGHMVVTGQGPDMRLQLWHLAKDSPRAFEMRQLVWNGATTTCAAFSPHTDSGKGFLVTGTRDGRVVVWPVPRSDEVAKPVMARITAIGEALTPATRDILIQAEVIGEKPATIVSGNSATLVIRP